MQGDDSPRKATANSVVAQSTDVRFRSSTPSPAMGPGQATSPYWTSMLSDIRQGSLRQDAASQIAHLKCPVRRPPRAHADQYVICDHHLRDVLVLRGPVTLAMGSAALRLTATLPLPLSPPGTWGSNPTCITGWCLRTKQVNMHIRCSAMRAIDKCLGLHPHGSCQETPGILTTLGHCSSCPPARKMVPPGVALCALLPGGEGELRTAAW